MVKIRTRLSRDEIEDDWSNQGFEMILEEGDDQIWVKQDEQEELLFASWVSCSVQVYKLDRVYDL